MALLLACGAVVRFLASRNDLWLDEIWSVQIAREVRAPIEIFTAQFLDNNHCLYTWFIHLLSGGGSDWLFRLPALIASLATIVLAGLIGRRTAGRPGALGAVLLTAGSYLLIHYGSEARGYAVAGAFALGAWYAALRGLGEKGRTWTTLFWGAVILGILSHATFIAEAYAGLLAWSLVRLSRLGLRGRSRWLAAAWWHAVPLLFILVFYLVRLRQMEIGGGPKFAWGFVLGRLCAFTVGLPGEGPMAALSIVLVVILLAAGLWLLRRQGSDLWVLYAACCFVFPLAQLLFRQPERLYERYFFVSVVFLVTLLGRIFAAGIRRPGAGRVATLVVAIVFLAGNGVHTARLLRNGRGHYAAALRFIQQTGAPVDGRIGIASDHDFRNRILVEYYVPRLPAGPRLEYLPSASDAPAAGAQWLIVHRRDLPTPPTLVVPAGQGGLFRFQRAFLSAPMSGFNWFIYRLEPGAERRAD